MSISAQKKLEKEFEKQIKNSIRFRKRNSLTKDVVVPNDYQLFNKMIGYPTNKNLDKLQPMTEYQVLYHDAINQFHKVIMNKSRKIGATEAAIRSIAMNVFRRYAGHDVMIVAGNELRIAREILIRFNELFKPNSGYSFKEPGKDGNVWHYDELIKRSTFGNTPEIEFANGTRVFAYAASMSEKRQTFRGPDDVVCIFLSEAAHTGMKNDKPIMNALKPNLANRADGDFIMESTPNGRRGFYFNYWQEAMKTLSEHYGISETKHQELVERLMHDWKNKKKLPSKLDWFPLRFDYMAGIGAGVISDKFIQSEKRDKQTDFEQEYNCAFTSTFTAAFDTSNLLTFKPTEDQDLLKRIGKKSVR